MGEVMFWLTVLVIVVLTVGHPDLLDAIIGYIQAHAGCP